MRYPVLTVYQPLASAIITGVKKSEYRTWAPPRSLAGEDLLIHAAANTTFLDDPLAMAALAKMWPDMPKDFVLGSIIGIVRLDSVGEDAPEGEARWEHPSCGGLRWAFSDPRPVEPFKTKGKPGIFYVNFSPESEE
jgi:hypothetical protein